MSRGNSRLLSEELVQRLQAQMIEIPAYDARSLSNTLEEVIDEAQRSGGRGSSRTVAAMARKEEATATAPDPETAAEIEQLKQACAGLEVQVRRYRQGNADLEAKAVVAEEETAALLQAIRGKNGGSAAGKGSGGDDDWADLELPSATEIGALLGQLYEMTRPED